MLTLPSHRRFSFASRDCGFSGREGPSVFRRAAETRWKRAVRSLVCSPSVTLAWAKDLPRGTTRMVLRAKTPLLQKVTNVRNFLKALKKIIPPRIPPVADMKAAAAPLQWRPV